MLKNLSSWFTSYMDNAAQYLTSASLWIQVPIVMVVLIPITGLLAIVLLRVIDTVGRWVLKQVRSLRAKVRTLNKTLVESKKAKDTGK